MSTERFAIFYADGSVVRDDGEDVEVTFRVPRAWRDAPRDGVQFVVCRRSDEKMQVLGAMDIYVATPEGHLISTNDLGALMRHAGLAKYGLWIPDDEFFAVREKANEYRREQAEGK